VYSVALVPTRRARIAAVAPGIRKYFSATNAAMDTPVYTAGRKDPFITNT
jgi:hypothetical protein